MKSERDSYNEFLLRTYLKAKAEFQATRNYKAEREKYHHYVRLESTPMLEWLIHMHDKHGLPPNLDTMEVIIDELSERIILGK